MVKIFFSRALLSLFFLVAGIQYGFSQCEIDNIYFNAGEALTYDLHMKFGISTKAGTGTLNVKNVTYAGNDAYKMSLTTNSQGFARKIFKLDDTLSCVMSKDLVPLAFMKDAHEGDDYTRERVGYAYSGDGSVKVKAVRYKNGGFRFDETIQFNNCAYDMLSIVYFARTLDYSNMKKGNKKRVDFISGKKKLKMEIVHDGTEKQKDSNGKKHNCIKLVLKISDNAFDNEEEAMKVYITNDANRLPIRIDSKLKVGSTRAVLKSYKGNKYPLGTSIESVKSQL
ncbi:DUF3108 domain-containing protein [Dysgonomonas sp. 216]|uniref:DUF3108 domain-containing protein n=1 Tax=Dysgonomonas sp. 216 TaxID=2302934 RepID=UPI0013D50A9A|nr:DUF3108 domain-containing protein [Dysgonomonas sp. 216]NDW18133.1 DUF3108 domain-containing protein [Dysgonomonas sp. 216]